jgi:hypothetical protein
MIRQQAVLPRGGKNVVREHAAPTRLPLDGGRAPRGGDNPFMSRTFGLTNVASVPDLLLSKPWPRQPGFCPYGISQEGSSLSEKSRPDRRQDAGVLSRLCGWALVRTDRLQREQDSNLYGAFPVKWSFGLLAVLYSERESRSSSRRLRSGSRSGRKGSRDRNGSIAWRLAASRRLCFAAP